MSSALASNPVALTPSGRPVLEDGEVEIKSEAGVQVWHQGGRTVLLPSCTVSVTNYRLIFIDGGCGVSLALGCVQRAEDVTSVFRHSKRLRLLCGSDDTMELKFLEGGKEVFLQHLQVAMEKRSWEHKPAPASRAAAPALFSGRTAGVGGLIRRQAQDISVAGSMAEAALADLDGLMKNARDIVSVVEKYSRLMAEAQTAEGMSETSSEIGDRNEMESILQNIGVISPVTKLSAGRLYHQQLAQQIADLLHAKSCLSRLGGMATVTDVYCLYNRARGTELVSPDDFYQAVLLFDKMTFLNLRVREFDSGVRVIAEAGLNMQQVLRRIQYLARESAAEGVSVAEVAAALQIPILVAKEQVHLAEREGLIVRDESFSGLQFFDNIFDALAAA